MNKNFFLNNIYSLTTDNILKNNKLPTWVLYLMQLCYIQSLFIYPIIW